MTDPDRQEGAKDPRPWEGPAAVRRDITPHRGDVLLLLAWVALVLAACGFCLGPVVPIAFPLASVAYILACRDPKRMEAGTVDPGGRARTEAARRLSCLAVAVGTADTLSGVVLAMVFGPMAVDL
jgi:hypothetical protein